MTGTPETPNKPKGETTEGGMMSGLPLGIAMGAGIGVAIGAAQDNIPMWTAFGVAIGIALAPAFASSGSSASRKDNTCSSGTDAQDEETKP